MKVFPQAIDRLRWRTTEFASQTQKVILEDPVDTVHLQSEPPKCWKAVAQACLSVGLLATVAAIPAPAVAQTLGSQRSCIQVDSKCQQLYQSLPAPAQKAFQQIPTGAKGLMASKLQGHTQLMGIKINNRKAFVEGKVMGQDTFTLVSNRLSLLEQKGLLPHNQLGPSQNFLNVSRRLTPSQRETLLDLILKDTL